MSFFTVPILNVFLYPASISFAAELDIPIFTANSFWVKPDNDLAFLNLSAKVVSGISE